MTAGTQGPLMGSRTADFFMELHRNADQFTADPPLVSNADTLGEPLTDAEISAVDIDALRVAYQRLRFEARYLRMRLWCEQASKREILATSEEIERERDRLRAMRL